MDMVSSGCPHASLSQLQAQVATLCREVTQLQRQRERSLEKDSFRVKVVRSNLFQGALPPGSLGRGGP